MKRKIIMLVGTLATLLAAFWVYQWIPWGDAPPLVERGTSGTRPSIPLSGHPGDRLKADTGEGLAWDTRYDDGRLSGRYMLNRWRKREDGGYEVKGVEIRRFGREGQRAYISAQRGLIYMEEAGRRLTIRRGKLTGNVRIFFDRSKDPSRPAVPDGFQNVARVAAQRRDEFIHVFADDLDFDNSLLSVHSAGDFKLWSKELDVYGRGLEIAWNEGPEALRILAVTEGTYLAIHEIPGQLALPGSAGPSGAKAKTPKPRPTAGPALATSPATRPGEKLQDNLYEIRITGDKALINVDAAETRLRGARVLTLKIEWDANWKPWRADPDAPKDRGRTAPTGARPATRPAGGDTPEAAPTPETKPMVVTWRGPLVIKPAGRTDTPSGRRYALSTIAGEGDRVLLSSDKAAVVCESFFVNNITRSGRLVGSADRPVLLMMRDGEAISCERIEFKGGQDGIEVTMPGPGYAIRRADGEPVDPELLLLARTLQQVLDTGGESIVWQESCLAHVVDKTFKDDQGKPASRQVLRDATFRGRMVLRGGSGDDSVHSDSLYILMGHLPDGTSYPDEALAIGNVVVRRRGVVVRADEATVRFKPPTPDAKRAEKTEKDKADRGPAAGLEITWLLAEGDVRVDATEGDKWRKVRAETVESDMEAGTVVLTGTDKKHAEIVEGAVGSPKPTSRLAGPKIILDEVRESVVVPGGGALDFQATRDAEGGPLATPRPVRITWSRFMEFQGKQNRAEFDPETRTLTAAKGRVTFASQSDRLVADSMRLRLQRSAGPATRPAATRPATRPDIGSEPDNPWSDRLAAMAQSYSRRRISMMFAKGNVVLSRLRKQDDRVLQGIRLTGRELHYFPLEKQMDVIGAGTLLVEEYRAPKAPKKRPAGRRGMDLAIDRPAQTYFQWRDGMQLLLAERQVSLRGGVYMKHVSGVHVVLAKELRVPDWGKLTRGRKTELNCEELMATFAAAPKKKETSPATAPAAASDDAFAGPQLGALEMLDAKRNVNLKDGDRKTRQFLAQRLIYERSKGVALVWGHLPGEPEASATLISEDRDAGTSQTWSSPKIRCLLDKDGRILRVDTQGIGGGGTR